MGTADSVSLIFNDVVCVTTTVCTHITIHLMFLVVRIVKFHMLEMVDVRKCHMFSLVTRVLKLFLELAFGKYGYKVVNWDQ